MKFTLSWLKDHLETSATLAEIKAKPVAARPILQINGPKVCYTRCHG